MSHQENEPRLVSRRTFLKKTAAIGMGAAAMGTLSACTASTATTSSNLPEWNKTVDVVVIGGGGTGLAAAISASKAGAGTSVLVLEAANAVGGSTSLSGGVIQAAGTKYEAEFQGVSDDTPEKHFQFYMQTAEGYVDEELVRVLTDNGPAAIDWMVEQGISYVNTYSVSPNPMVEEQYRLPRIHIPGGGGDAAKAGTGAVHIEVLNNAVKALGLEVMTDTPATDLIYEEGKGVVGVKASSNGEDYFVKANKGVIIATSGFDRSEEMCKAFSLQQLWELQTGMCFTAPNDNGSGIKMAMDLGADLAGLGGTIGVPFVTMGTDKLSDLAVIVPGIWVNVNGQRFVNEGAHYAYVIRAVFNQQAHKAWAIFDDKVRSMGGAALGGIWGAWTDDLAEEIAAGKVVKADTLEELATAIGVNPAVLPLTVQKWNEDAAAGVDNVFGKTVGLQALETGPFYATPVTSVNLGTCGGLKINAKCQVIDVNGEVIPHLYAGGMAAGGFIGPYYPGSGTAVLATVVHGRIAGENAAKETAF